MINNLINHFRVKHINIFYHYVRNKVKEKAIQLFYILIEQMITDELIKSLKVSKFLIFKELMRLSAESFN